MKHFVNNFLLYTHAITSKLWTLLYDEEICHFSVMIFKTRIYKRIRVTRQLLHKNSNVSFKSFNSLLMNLLTNSLFDKDRPKRNWKSSMLLGFCQNCKVWYRLVKFSKHRVSSMSRHTVDVCSRWTPVETRQRQASKKRAKRKKAARRGERGGRVQWHSSGTRKRHGGISEIAPDIFACSVYIASRVAASCGSLLLFISPSFILIHFQAACFFKVLAIEITGYIDIWRYLLKSGTRQESSRRRDVDFDSKWVIAKVERCINFDCE